MFRSPIAKALFNQNPVPGWKAESYGTAVQAEGRQGIKLSQYGPGIRMTIAEMKKQDLDISNEFCNQILPEYIADKDKIIMMSEKEFIPEWLNTYQWEYWEVPNPDSITQEILEGVIALLSKNIETLKKTLT